jgi:2Fe-2S ferredoxin
MLTNVAAERRPESRLSCQLRVTPALDGLTVRFPVRQS